MRVFVMLGMAAAYLLCMAAAALAQFTDVWTGVISGQNYRRAQQVHSAVVERAQAVWGTNWQANITAAPRPWVFDRMNLTNEKRNVDALLTAVYWLPHWLAATGRYDGALSAVDSRWWRLAASDGDGDLLGGTNAINTNLFMLAGAPSNYLASTPWAGLSGSEYGWKHLPAVLTNLLVFARNANGDPLRAGAAAYRTPQWDEWPYPGGRDSIGVWRDPGFTNYLGQIGDATDTWANAKTSAEADFRTNNAALRFTAWAWMATEGAADFATNYTARRDTFVNVLRQSVCTGMTPRLDLYGYVRAPQFDAPTFGATLDGDGYLETAATGAMVRVAYTNAAGPAVVMPIGATNYLSTWCGEPSAVTNLARGWLLWSPVDSGNPLASVLVEWYTNDFRYK